MLHYVAARAAKISGGVLQHRRRLYNALWEMLLNSSRVGDTTRGPHAVAGIFLGVRVLKVHEPIDVITVGADVPVAVSDNLQGVA